MTPIYNLIDIYLKLHLYSLIVLSFSIQEHYWYTFPNFPYHPNIIYFLIHVSLSVAYHRNPLPWQFLQVYFWLQLPNLLLFPILLLVSANILRETFNFGVIIIPSNPFFRSWNFKLTQEVAHVKRNICASLWEHS